VFFLVTVRTCQFSVLTGVILELGDLFRVTCEAGIGQIVGKRDIERGVRICVTTQAILQFEMRQAFMTVAALRNIVFYDRWMAVVAVYTGNACFMLSPGRFYVSGGLLVAYNT
jgi:hypothetical protein